MKEQQVETNPISLEKEINQWDYDKSVKKMRQLVSRWKDITSEMLRELYLAKEAIANQKNQGKDTENCQALSWGGYCGEIGLSYQTANNWLAKFRFIPRELSPTGKDTLLALEAPLKTETPMSRALMQTRINDVLRTGERPVDFSKEEEAELNRQVKNAKLTMFAEKAAEYNAPTYFKANDYFADALKRSKDITNFKLEDDVQIQAQYRIFKLIEEYLGAFGKPEIRARAAFNLALKARNLANEIAEMNFSLSEAEKSETPEARGRKVKTVEEHIRNNLSLKIEFFNNAGTYSFGMSTQIGNGGIGFRPMGKFSSIDEAERAALDTIYERHNDPAQVALIKKFQFVKEMKQKPIVSPRKKGSK